MSNPYADLTIEELEAANQELMAQREDIKERQRLLWEVLDPLLQKRELARRLGDLAHLIGEVGDIGSREQVGGLKSRDL